MKKADVIIIGAGAAGLMTAVNIGKNLKKKADIIVLEHKEKPGKKLLATGNGRCNFANDVIDDESFRGTNSSFAYKLINEFTKENLLDLFYEIGVMNTSINGYYYPRSLQATTVVDALINYIDLYNIKIKCDENVLELKHSKGNYHIVTQNEEYLSKYVVLATGGKSYKTLGSDGSGYKLAKSFGHTVTALYPSLIGLKASGLDFKMASGVRAKGVVSLYMKDKVICEQEGEIQFADYGISGIPVFQISRYASEIIASGKKAVVSVDLVKEYDILDIKNILSEILKANKKQNILNALNAFIPLKLAKAILKRQKINIEDTHKQIDNCKLLSIASEMKQLKLSIEGDLGFDKAQVTAGGINTDEIDNKTLESKKSKNLFIVGELLDIDGNCGGYNLHFAFACGKNAGETISERINNNE